MAGNIKGITIEIDGNTQPLSNALKDLNKDIKSVDKELKNVDQALKLDPGNAEQVSRKLELLEEKAELAEKKVERLKEAQKQMDSAGVDKASKEYQNLTTEIAKAEGAYREIQTQIERTGTSFNEVTEGSKQLQTFLSATGKSAEDLTSILGSKLVDAIKSGQLGAAGYQSVLDKLATSFTGSKNNAEEFRRVLNTIDQGNSLDQIKQDLEAIGRVNVSGLGAEFDRLNQKSSSLDNELKQINQSLKLDPSSLDLCAQKQEVLSQAVSTSEAKLQQLNQRFAELKSNNVDLNDEEFRNLQREIANTESSLTSYKSQLNDLENAQQRLNTYFSATGTSVKDFANVLGSDLVAKIERGEASSQELANALDKIGASATQNSGDIERFKSTLDSVDSGVSFDRINSELNRLGSEFNESESDVESFKSKLESIADSTAASAITEVSDQIGELGDSFAEFGEGAIEAAGTVQDSTNSMKINLGLTDDAAREMSEHAQNVYFANYGQSLEDVTEAIVFMQQNLDDVNGDNIEALTSQALTLSDTMGVDLNEAIRGVKSMTEAYGISSEEAFDLMVKGAQNGMNVSDELGDNLAEYSPLFKDSGYSASEMFSILQAGLDAGAYNLDKVNDLVKEFGIRISDGSVEKAVQDLGGSFEETFNRMKESGASNKDIFSALVGEVKNLGSEQEKAAAISAIFGTQGEDAGIKVIEAMGSVADSYSDVSGAAQQAADDNSNAVGSMQRNWEALGQAFAPLGEDLAELANMILETIVPAVQGMVEWFTNLPEPIKRIIEIAGVLVVGLTALAPIISAISSAIGIIIPIITAVAGAIGTVVSGIATVLGVIGAPFLAAIAAVVAVVVGLIAYFNNWGGCADWLNEKWSQFIEWLTGIFSGLGDTIGALWNTFCTELQTEWNNLWTLVQEGWNAVSEWFMNIFTTIGETVGQAWSNFTQGISDSWNLIWTTIQESWEAVTEWFQTIFDNLGLSDLWNNAVSGITETWNNIWDGIQKAWDGISSWFSSAFDSVKSAVSDIWNKFIDFLSNTWNDFWEREKNGWTNIFNFLSDTFNSIKENATNIWNNITSFLSDTWNSIKDNANNIWNNISSFLSDTWNNLKSNAGSAWDNIKSTITNNAQNIRDNLSNKWNEVVNDFSNIWNGLKDKASQIWENVKNVVSNGVRALKNMMNFSWSLPKIKLPHFRISGNFSLNPPSVPSIGIDWYKKGGILTAPTIFGMNGNSLLGGGEAGKEAVMPIDTLKTYIREELEALNLGDKLDKLIELQNPNIQVVLDSGQLVGQITPQIDRSLGMRQKRMARQ